MVFAEISATIFLIVLREFDHSLVLVFYCSYFFLFYLTSIAFAGKKSFEGIEGSGEAASYI
jgi:hypothetical protein